MVEYKRVLQTSCLYRFLCTLGRLYQNSLTAKGLSSLKAWTGNSIVVGFLFGHQQMYDFYGNSLLYVFLKKILQGIDRFIGMLAILFGKAASSSLVVRVLERGFHEARCSPLKALQLFIIGFSVGFIAFRPTGTNFIGLAVANGLTALLVQYQGRGTDFLEGSYCYRVYKSLFD